MAAPVGAKHNGVRAIKTNNAACQAGWSARPTRPAQVADFSTRRSRARATTQYRSEHRTGSAYPPVCVVDNEGARRNEGRDGGEEKERKSFLTESSVKGERRIKRTERKKGGKNV